MTEVTPPRRTYDSPRRREQAIATRRKILDAARELFEADGYDATSIAAIATEAGVSVKTVYLAFATKSGLLIALWNVLLRGDEESVPVGMREWYMAVLDEPDPREQLRMNARNATAARQRVAGVLEVIRGAAGAEPEIAALWRRIQNEYFENQRAIVESIAGKGALRPGLDTDRAADILWTLNNPSGYQALVVERGWPPEGYEQWLAEVTIEQLVGSDD